MKYSNSRQKTSSVRVRLPCNFFTTALPASATSLQLIELTSADVCALITRSFTFTLSTSDMPLVDTAVLLTQRYIRHCLVPYRCLVSVSGTHVASSTSFISVAITHTVYVSRLIVGRIAVLRIHLYVHRRCGLLLPT